MAILFRIVLLVFALLLAAFPSGAGASSGRPDRKPTISQLKREANQAAARFDRARVAYERLNDEVSALEQQVGRLRTEMAPLRDAVTRRAVALYKSARGLDALAGLGNQPDPVSSARGARIVSQASAADLDAIEQLAASAARLRDQQEALNARRQEQETALEKLDGERKDVEQQLAMMLRAGRELQSRLMKTPLRPVAARADRGSREAAALAPVDPSIPVATDFICPIRGPLAFSDSWGDPRSGGRRHKGTDLMSPHGTDNVAVVSGGFRRHHSGAGGLSIYLYGDDGNTYYYAHLSEVVGPDRRVARGEVIGKTGNSGNARGGSPHTHFELHAGGGEAVNPYPVLAAHC